MPVPDCVDQREIGLTPSVVLRILASHVDRSNQDIQRVVELLTRYVPVYDETLEVFDGN